jgi:nucleotide-binding universal stress UspA family protein
MSRIVVGVDGSDESQRALAFALEEAKLRGAELDVVHAWHYPPVAGSGFAPPVDEAVYKTVADAAQELVDDAVEVARAAGVEARGAAVEGPPAETLVEVADGADILVVGSRGRGGFTGLLLGSVSQQCAHHARCTVAIVPRGA